MPPELQAFLDFLVIFAEVVAVVFVLIFFIVVIAAVIKGAFDDFVRLMGFIHDRLSKRSNENPV